MKVKTSEVKVVKTVKIELELTPQELATITAAIGVTSDIKRAASHNVASDHQTKSVESRALHLALRDAYFDLVKGGAYE